MPRSFFGSGNVLVGIDSFLASLTKKKTLQVSQERADGEFGLMVQEAKVLPDHLSIFSWVVFDRVGFDNVVPGHLRFQLMAAGFQCDLPVYIN